MPFSQIAQGFVRSWDLDQTKILRPSRLVFLCGGVLASRADAAASARDAFLRQFNDEKLDGATIVLAEKANIMLPASSFQNLLDLEEYIGAIVDSVLLFVESPGSICELGAFCKIPDIADRLSTFVMNDHVIRSSFIRNGPLQYIKNADGTDNFSVYDWSITDSVVAIADFVLSDITNECINASHSRGIKESFDANSLSHQIYSILGIAFLLRGGLLSEIKECARVIWPYLTESKIRHALDALQIVDLIKPVSNGKTTYYIPTTDRLNLDVTLLPGGTIRDPLRWLTDINAAIGEEDPNRLERFGAHNGAA